MRLALLLPLFLIGCCSQPTQGTADQASFAAAARAIDGDTLSVDFRLLGLDAPEKRQLCANDQGWWPCGKAAQDYLARALRDQEVRITLASGRTYRRRVATVEVSGVDLGERLIAAGLAVPAVQYLKSDPDRATRYQRAFATAVRHGGSEAYFSPTFDYIQMPRPSSFDSMDLYASTRLHETVHWSGHASRLARTFGKRFGDQAYAFEELVAEIGAGLGCAELGLPNELHQSHASYVSHWLSILRGDKSAIIHAAAKAEQAITFLGAFGGTSCDAPDEDMATPSEQREGV